MINIDVTHSDLINEFLNRYQIWADNKHFYQNYNAINLTKDECGIPCYKFYQLELINNSSSDIILIDALTEGLHSKQVFERYNSSKHYIFLSNYWDINQIKFDFSYDLIWYPWFLFETADTYLSPGRFCFYLDKNYKFDYPKQMDFLCLAGSNRPERDYLITQLSNISDNNCILKYNGKDYTVDSTIYDVVKFDKGFDPYTPILEKYYHNVGQTLPIAMYNQCYFNVLVETDIDVEHSFLPTEKIIKTLVTGMPFVAVATQHFLKNLQELGFKTYQTVWDESYDHEPNYQKRIDKVVELCNNLKNFDWQSNKEQLEMVANHNAKNFLNLNYFADRMFLNFESVLRRITND